MFPWKTKEIVKLLGDYLNRVDKVESKVEELDEDLKEMNKVMVKIQGTLEKLSYVAMVLLASNNPISSELLKNLVVKSQSTSPIVQDIDNESTSSDKSN